MDVSPTEDVVVSISMMEQPTRKPAKPPILITTIETRQAQPDTMIALPAEKAILSPSRVVTGLVLGTLAIVSQPWRVDMNFVQLTPVRISIAVFAFASLLLAYAAHLNIQERKKALERRRDLRNAPACNLNSAPQLKLVA